MVELLRPILPHRDKIGYVAARNTRILSQTLIEYFQFKHELLKKYGDIDLDENGKQKGTVSLKPDSPNFEEFSKEFDPIKDIEHEVELMTIPYEEVIGLLNGEEILKLEFMLTE